MREDFVGAVEQCGEMRVTFEIPDDLGYRRGATGGDMSRRSMEAMAAAGYRTGDPIDTFLREHGIWLDYTRDDLGRDRARLQRPGF